MHMSHAILFVLILFVFGCSPSSNILSYIEKNDFSETEKCINSGIDLNKQYYLRHIPSYPLTIACMGSDITIIKLLLDSGANPNVVDNRLQMTPVQTAVWQRHPHLDELVPLLIKYGGDINMNAGKDNTLDYAISSGDLQAIKVLIDNKAIINNDSIITTCNTYPMVSESEIEKIIVYFLDKGLDINYMDVNYPNEKLKGLSALDVAILNKNPELKKFLISHGAKTAETIRKERLKDSP